MAQIEVLHRRLVEQGPQGRAEQVLFLLLCLVAKLYGLAISVRDLSFRLGLRKVYRSRLPVVAVGNLAVGGTGKTPMVDLLIRYVQHRGCRVAVVSRGYGGRYAGELGIVSRGEGLLMSAADAGDEPCLLARRNPTATVLVSAKRRSAIQYIETHDCADLVILDDAFQHRQVARDLNLLLLDAGAPFGNSRLLPAGFLREPSAALARADLICLTGVAGVNPLPSFTRPVVGVRSTLSERVVSLAGESQLLCSLVGKKIVAFAGIARPERFFESLKAGGLQLSAQLAMGDHVHYDRSSLSKINAAAVGADILLTTEKDAVKLVAEDLLLPCFSVGLDVHLDECPSFYARLDVLLNKENTMSLRAELLEILACPKCKGPVSLEKKTDHESINCAQCLLVYPIRDGIPVMLIDEAISIEG